MSELKAQADAYFESYPDEKVIHFTSDGQAFFAKNYNDAVNHQRRLDPKIQLSSFSNKVLLEPADDEAEKQYPDDSWSEDQLMQWLQANGVEVTGEESKDVLLTLATEFIMSKNEDAGDDDAEPTSEWTNEAIRQWLTDAGVETKPNEKKADLLEKVKSVLTLDSDKE